MGSDDSPHGSGPGTLRRLVLHPPVACAPVVWAAVAVPTEAGQAPPWGLPLLAPEVLMPAMAAPTVEDPASHRLLLALPPEETQESPHTGSRRTGQPQLISIAQRWFVTFFYQASSFLIIVFALFSFIFIFCIDYIFLFFIYLFS